MALLCGLLRVEAGHLCVVIHQQCQSGEVFQFDPLWNWSTIDLHQSQIIEILESITALNNVSCHHTSPISIGQGIKLYNSKDMPRCVSVL